MNQKLACQYMALIDPSGKRPIGTGYRLGSGDFTDHVVPTSRGVVRYFKQQNQAGNMWVCPAPRMSHTRRKGGAARSYVLWADFDGKGRGMENAIPLVPHVWPVRSGSVGHYHYYLLLSQPIGWRDLTLGNWLLARVIGGDNKWSDESLLRLPGTINPKTGAEVVPEVPLDRVVPVRATDAIRALAGLLGMSGVALRVKRDALALGIRTTRALHVVDVPDEKRRKLPGSAKSQLAANQFRTRGDRSDSRYGFWKDFWKAGLTLDETYTLMLKFDPMNDVYDWESDLVRLWAKYERGL